MNDNKLNSGLVIYTSERAGWLFKSIVELGVLLFPDQLPIILHDFDSCFKSSLMIGYR